MLKFNSVLRDHGFEPSKVFLLRHEDKRVSKPMYQVWKTQREDFETYQSYQKWKHRFGKGSSLATFVVGSAGETLFVGMYDIVKCSEHNGPFSDPLTGPQPAAKSAYHQIKRSSRMAELEERLVIDWGRGMAWRQYANKQNKDVIEIRSEPKNPPFPPYVNFIGRIADLSGIYQTWQERLKERKGVYLLTFEDGFHYVGSATGEEGFWQRWTDYRKNGHGGNLVLRQDQRDARKATVSILEISGSAQSSQDIIRQEMIWKQKLGSRAKSLEAEKLV